MPNLAKDTRPFFVLLATDENHVRTVERTAPAPCDTADFTHEHEGWMQTAHAAGHALVTVYATDYDTARELALDDARHGFITHHRAYGLQGMPRTAPAYEVRSYQHGTPDQIHAHIAPEELREALTRHLAVASGKSWTVGRTIHVDVPIDGKAPLHFTYTPIDH
ncbi:hypothetical protein ACFCWY_08620 [Streptomyces sp. NPDC056362]|uniref:hypothetical protein n=1 Tax=unclassified Streptomyces TaxID=2593676 RepID=UPI0035DFC0EB